MSSSSSTPSARQLAALEARFLSSLSGWKVANHELDELASQVANLTSEREELQLVQGELERLEPEALVYRAVGPLLQPLSLGDARTSTDRRAKLVAEELTRLGKREQALAEKQRQRRMQLHDMQKQLPHIPEAVYTV
jgi:prefoldin beta subunit